MRARRTGFSSATLRDFVGQDAEFMNKISAALTTVHQNYGHKAVQDCLQVNEVTGNCDVDLEILCAMMDRSQDKLKSECCTMFMMNKGILGSFAYLFGSLLFGFVTYWQPIGWPLTFSCIAATTLYLIGGLLFIWAAIQPYWEERLKIGAISTDCYELKQRGAIVAKMGERRTSCRDGNIRARMSKLNIDASVLLAPNAAELEAIQEKKDKKKKKLKRSSTNSFIGVDMDMESSQSGSTEDDIFDVVRHEVSRPQSCTPPHPQEQHLVAEEIAVQIDALIDI